MHRFLRSQNSYGKKCGKTNVIIGVKVDPTMQTGIKAVVVLSGLDEENLLGDHSVRDIFQALRISQ